MASAVGNSLYEMFFDLFTGAGSAITGLHLHLYTNTPTLSRDSVPGDFVEPSGGTGYALISIPLTAFTVSPGSPPFMSDSVISDFTFGSAVTINGYYVTDQSDSLFLWGEDIGPFPFGAAGGTLTPNSLTVSGT